MLDDYSLLRRFADRRDHAAFTQLVDRYVNFVYDVALRRANGAAPAAADATENVFAQLARAAGKLPPDIVLAAWLHGATRSAVGKHGAGDDRRDTQAKSSAARRSAETSGAEWNALRPVLDDAVDELLDSDRTPLVLRYFRRLGFAETGTALALTEDAARLRVERAVERLCPLLAKRGITATPAGLAATMSTAPAFPAPDGLGARIAATGGTSAAPTRFGDTVAAFLNAKTLGFALVVAVAAFALGAWYRTEPTRETTSPENRQLQLTIAELRDDNGRLKAQVATLSAEIEQMKRAATEAAARKSIAPVAPPHSATTTEIPAPAGVDAGSDATGRADATGDAHFQELKRRVEPALERAIAAYRAAHQGNNPTGPQELVPYFSTPQEGADFIEFVEAGKRGP